MTIDLMWIRCQRNQKTTFSSSFLRNCSYVPLLSYTTSFSPLQSLKASEHHQTANINWTLANQFTKHLNYVIVSVCGSIRLKYQWCVVWIDTVQLDLFYNWYKEFDPERIEFSIGCINCGSSNSFSLCSSTNDISIVPNSHCDYKIQMMRW